MNESDISYLAGLFDGKIVSREEAKAYIVNYGKKKVESWPPTD